MVLLEFLHDAVNIINNNSNKFLIPDWGILQMVGETLCRPLCLLKETAGLTRLKIIGNLLGFVKRIQIETKACWKRSVRRDATQPDMNTYEHEHLEPIDSLSLFLSKAKWN